jgi:hypothetical protein
MVVDLAARDDRNHLVQQADHVPDQAGLRLAPLAQHDDVVPGQDPPLQGGEDRVVEADDRREQLLALRQSSQQVLAELFLDAAIGIAGGAKLADGGGGGCDVHPGRVPPDPDKWAGP